MNPMIGIMGDAVMKQMVPERRGRHRVPGRRQGRSVEYLQAAMGQPAGTINLITPDGTLIVSESEREDVLENERCRRRWTR